MCAGCLSRERVCGERAECVRKVCGERAESAESVSRVSLPLSPAAGVCKSGERIDVTSERIGGLTAVCGGFRVQVWGSEFEVQSLGFRIQGSGSGDEGLH